MKRTSQLIAVLLLLMCLNSVAITQENSEKKEWWQAGWRGWPKENPMAKKLPLIKVSGNRFVNANGDTILFRGLAIGDPDKIADQQHWSKQYFEKVKEMGAMFVRIPVHPIAWRDRTPEGYFELLDQVVQWCTELDMYVIIDWHSIGNLGMELFQAPMYETSKKETYEFWRQIAFHFRGHNTVAFYEIFNEPTQFHGMLGSMTWSEWKKINEDIISLIRAYDKETIPLVAGFDWAYDLNPIRYEPINVEGIGYVTHPYPMKRKAPWPEKWEENFGFAAGRYPVIATEIGFGLRDGDITDENHYGPIIINFLENRSISWVAWVFDPDWHPSLFESWDTYKLTGSGEFFKKALHGEIIK
ncbi:cellulase family glycosylhydrolase [candidate division KSB1 bacterium]|nr:cellulase family glycosylhydrolase [candidate division KSB1 bacterium]